MSLELEELRNRRQAVLRGRPDCRESESEAWYRPGQLLVQPAHQEGLHDVLRDAGGLHDRTLDANRAGVARYHVEDAERVLRLDAVRSAADRLDGGDQTRAAAVSLNHVLQGEPCYVGGPAAPPAPVLQLDPTGSGRIRVAVLDTGISPHPWLRGRYDAEGSDLEVMDEDGDGLRDLQAGHGTFVAGLVLRHAPAAHVRVIRVLDSFGVTDEVRLINALRRVADAHVVNLSLGGYSVLDRPPTGLAEALDRLAEGALVVASAGNAGIADRPFWPAAFPADRVIAVGALDERGQRPAFSNSGAWVDVSRPGVDVVSTFPVWDGSAPPTAGGDPDRFDGLAQWSGTSFAAARLSGELAAAMREMDTTDARAAFARLVASGAVGPDGSATSTPVVAAGS